MAQRAIHHSDYDGSVLVTLTDRRHPEAPSVTIVGSHDEYLPHLTFDDIKGVIGLDRKCDVTLWGDGLTWTVTELEAQSLSALGYERKLKAEARERARDEADRLEAERWAALPASMKPCPRCGTYCDGDCDS